MFRKISSWYMEQKMSHILLALYLMASITATIMVPDGGGLVLWAWGAGAALVVGPWMWSLNEITKKSTGKSLWG